MIDPEIEKYYITIGECIEALIVKLPPIDRASSRLRIAILSLRQAQEMLHNAEYLQTEYV